MIKKFQRVQKRTRVLYTNIITGISLCCESLEDLSKLLDYKSSGYVSNVLNGRIKSLKFKLEKIEEIK